MKEVAGDVFREMFRALWSAKKHSSGNSNPHRKLQIYVELERSPRELQKIIIQNSGNENYVVKRGFAGYAVKMFSHLYVHQFANSHWVWDVTFGN